MSNEVQLLDWPIPYFSEQVSSMYDDCMEAFHKRFDDLVEAVRTIEDVYQRMSLLNLFNTIVAANPQVRRSSKILSFKIACVLKIRPKS